MSNAFWGVQKGRGADPSTRSQTIGTSSIASSSRTPRSSSDARVVRIDVWTAPRYASVIDDKLDEGRVYEDTPTNRGMLGSLQQPVYNSLKGSRPLHDRSETARANSRAERDCSRHRRYGRLTRSQPEAKLVLQAPLGMRGSTSYLVADRNLVVEGLTIGFCRSWRVAAGRGRGRCSRSDAAREVHSRDGRQGIRREGPDVRPNCVACDQPAPHRTQDTFNRLLRTFKLRLTLGPLEPLKDAVRPEQRIKIINL
jgi:hypothetical protein